MSTAAATTGSSVSVWEKADLGLDPEAFAKKYAGRVVRVLAGDLPVRPSRSTAPSQNTPCELVVVGWTHAEVILGTRNPGLGNSDPLGRIFARQCYWLPNLEAYAFANLLRMGVPLLGDVLVEQEIGHVTSVTHDPAPEAPSLPKATVDDLAKPDASYAAPGPCYLCARRHGYANGPGRPRICESCNVIHIVAPMVERLEAELKTMPKRTDP